MRAVARAVPTIVITGVGHGYAAKVRADAEYDEPVWVEGAFCVGLLVSQFAGGECAGDFCDLFGGAVLDEDGLGVEVEVEGGLANRPRSVFSNSEAE